MGRLPPDTHKNRDRGRIVSYRRTISKCQKTKEKLNAEGEILELEPHVLSHFYLVIDEK